MSAADTWIPRRLSADLRHLALAGSTLLVLIAVGCTSMLALNVAPDNTAVFDIPPGDSGGGRITLDSRDTRPVPLSASHWPSTSVCMSG